MLIAFILTVVVMIIIVMIKANVTIISIINLSFCKSLTPCSFIPKCVHLRKYPKRLEPVTEHLTELQSTIIKKNKKTDHVTLLLEDIMLARLRLTVACAIIMFMEVVLYVSLLDL